ncbi:Phosphoadenosine phosphosulfate reductase [Candidatus Hodgkinia cicadicola]|nr:Phosphoadenosine phosphosulfate reductase [Candidatus Hodgkinia cicadicola]
MIYCLSYVFVARLALSWLSLTSCVLSFKSLNVKCMLTTSLSQEDQLLLLDCVLAEKWDWRVVSLNTNKLFGEVWVLLTRLRSELGTRCFVCYPDVSSVLSYKQSSCGLNIYSSIGVRALCCKVRKVIPLISAIMRLKTKLWVTGLRRLQCESRDETCIIQYDSKFDCVKLNPLLCWRASDLARVLVSRCIEYNCLLNLGYKSVGCAPCTRAIRPWERARAGRWWWERTCGLSGECGLHVS